MYVFRFILFFNKKYILFIIKQTRLKLSVVDVRLYISPFPAKSSSANYLFIDKYF
jgi:hypothetical protein